MKIIVIGAGELGRLLAKTLLQKNHEVVLIDSSFEELERLGDRLDILCIEGSCTSVATLKKAGIETADALVAVSGDEASNILSCQLAAKMGIQRTICRLFRSDSFSEQDGVGASEFGIWKTFSTPDVSVQKLLGILDNRAIRERIVFGDSGAEMSVMQILPASQLLGVRLQDISCGDLINRVRLAAVLHDKHFVIPHGDTILGKGDKIYVAGKSKDVHEFIEWVAPSDFVQGRVVISGAGETGRLLAKEALKRGYDVRLIELKRHSIDKALDELPSGIMLIKGDPTDEEILEEAGAGAAEVFVSAGDDDENNILSCILAKRAGARKVAVLTHKPEYIGIVPTMELIDCGFSASLISVNTILKMLDGSLAHLDANLQSYGAFFAEFKVTKASPLAGKMMKFCDLPKTTVLALLLRGAETITPSGSTVLEPGDIAVAVVTRESAKKLAPLFPED